MKVLTGLLLAAVLLAPAAEAGLFGGGSKKLPRPIDSPSVRPKVREDHKLGKRGGVHPRRGLDPMWGLDAHRTMNISRPKQLGPHRHDQ
jgi:hypothetical protein